MAPKMDDDDLSPSMLCLLLALALSLLYMAKDALRLRRSRLPPGPSQLPVIGNLHQLGPKPHKSLAKLAQTYGPVMSLQLGRLTAVIISSASAAKQVMQKQDLAFANRSIPDSLMACDHGNLSVAWIPLSPKWRELRAICNKHIFTSRKMEAFEPARRRKVGDLIAEFERRASRGDPVLIGEAFFKTLLNFLSSIFLSRDLDEGDSGVAREFMESFVKIMELGGQPNLVDYFSWLKRVDPQRIKARSTPHIAKMLAFVDSMVSERLARGEDHGGDVLDTLIQSMQESNGEFTRADIGHLFVDLFIGGTDTTSSTLEWAISEMMKSPGAVSKAKDELARVVGKGRQVEDGDIPNLPYLQAVVKETLRLHPPVPFLLPRKNIKDEELWGYTVPKDSQVMVNAWAIGRDPSSWDSPNSFKPERFLDSEVDVKGGQFELIPFGAGRRICVGMPLALKMMHLMLGSVLNCFDLVLEGDAKPEELDMEDEFGLSLHRAQPLRAIPVPVRV
uniref:Cytochrome P450 n=1 Tax=Kalanchoe fedtschenkoi TaxID=63787 RepID=A0A7N0U189_KALFE